MFINVLLNNKYNKYNIFRLNLLYINAVCSYYIINKIFNYLLNICKNLIKFINDLITEHDYV